MSGFPNPASGQNKIQSTSRAPHYFWDAPDGGRIIMAVPVADRINQEVMKAYRALPRRGLEIGGILLGRVFGRDPLEVLVQAFEPMPCEHRYGPSLILSDADRAQLEQILAHPASWPEYSAVGYFRSFTGRQIELDDTDQELMGRWFQDPGQVILALQPVSATQCLSWWFVRQDVEPWAKPAAMPASFGDGPAEDFEPPPEPQRKAPAAPAGPVHAASTPAPVPEPAAPILVAELEPEPDPPPRPTLAPPRVAPRQPDPEPVRAAPRRLWPWALAMAAAVAGFAAMHRWIGQSVSQPLSSPELTAHRTASGIELTWDGPALARQQATGGLLAISDGDSKSQIELDAAAVARGHLTYKPSDNEIRFHLSVFGPEKQWTAASFHMPRPEPALAAAVEQPEPEPAPPVSPQASAEPDRLVEAGPQAKPPAAPPAPKPAARASADPAVPPEVIHQVQPGLSDAVRARLKSPVTVPVIVQIDASGKVTRASAQGAGDGLYHYLCERARLAARFWRFQPARAKNGTPVPSSKTVFFTFRN